MGLSTWYVKRSYQGLSGAAEAGACPILGEPVLARAPASSVVVQQRHSKDHTCAAPIQICGVVTYLCSNPTCIPELKSQLTSCK